MVDSTEHVWVEGAKRGDRQAIAELDKQYWRAAWATARSGQVIEPDFTAGMMEELKALRDQPPVS